MKNIIVILNIVTAISCQVKSKNNFDSKGVLAIDRSWDDSKINLCWVIPKTSELLANEQDVFKTFPTLRDDIKQHVESQFERTEKVRIVGWQDCAVLKQTDYQTYLYSIRLMLDPSTENQSGGGSSVIGPETSVRGKYGFTTFVGVGEYNDPTIKKFVLASALHEISHAVGLHHEHQRTEREELLQNNTIKRCKDIDNTNHSNREPIPQSPTIRYVDKYDEKSIMHYCNDNSTFSSSDIRSINYLYGALQKIKLSDLIIKSGLKNNDGEEIVGTNDREFVAQEKFGFLGINLPKEYLGKKVNLLFQASLLNCENNKVMIALLAKNNFKTPITTRDIQYCGDSDNLLEQADFTIPNTGEFVIGFWIPQKSSVIPYKLLIENLDYLIKTP